MRISDWSSDVCSSDLLTEGILAELASVTPFAAIESLRKKNVMTPKDRVVAIVTASGLKDIDRSMLKKGPLQFFNSVAQAWSNISPGIRSPSRSDPVFATARNTGSQEQKVLGKEPNQI